MPPRNRVQVISRAAEIMRVLHDSPQGLTLAEVARRVGLPRSTVHRIVGTLELEGFVAPARADGRLRLGPELGAWRRRRAPSSCRLRGHSWS